MSYVTLCQYGNFLDDTSYELLNKYCHGWQIGQNHTFSYRKIVMKYFTWMIGTWIENNLVSDSNCNNVRVKLQRVRR